MVFGLPHLTPFMSGGVICLPFCTCLTQPRRAVKRRSLPGAVYYIAHAFLCTAMVTGVACAFLLRNHAHATLESSGRWAEVQWSSREEVAGLLFGEALRLAYPLLFLSPFITAAALAYFALHLRASPIVHPWACAPSIILSAALQLACALLPLPALQGEAALEQTEWAALPDVGEVWTSAARLDKATLFFSAAGWSLLLLVWAMAYGSRRWAAEPHFEHLDEWVVTEEDGAEEDRASVGDAEDEQAEAAPPSRSPVQRRGRRRIEAARASPIDLPDSLPDGPHSYHIRRKLVPLAKARLEVLPACSDPALLVATTLLTLTVGFIVLSYLSYDVIAWRQPMATFDLDSGHREGWSEVHLGWVSGTNVSSSSPFAMHPWSRLHLRSFRHPYATLGWLALLSALLSIIGWVTVWLFLSYSHVADGFFHLTVAVSPAVEGCVLALMDCACNVASQGLAWRECQAVRQGYSLQELEEVRLGRGAALWLAAAVCRLLAVSIVAARMWRDHPLWLQHRKGKGKGDAAKQPRRQPRPDNGDALDPRMRAPVVGAKVDK